jgi:hypothetical protein
MRRQVLVPVVTDQDGNMIDGFARAAIAAELGVKNVPANFSIKLPFCYYDSAQK